MKKIIVAVGAVLIAITWFAVARQASAKPHDAAAIKALEEKRAKTIDARDVEGVMSLYAPDVFAFDVIPPRQKIGAKAYRENYVAFFATPVKVEVSDLNITVAGDVAYSHQIQHVTASYEGKPVDLTVRISDVYRKIKGKWLIVQEHISVPVDLDTGKPDLMSKP